MEVVICLISHAGALYTSKVKNELVGRGSGNACPRTMGAGS